MDQEVIAALNDEGVVMVLGRLQAADSALWAERVAVTQEADRRECWKPDGSRSLAEWLVAQLHIDLATGRRLAATARRLAELPAMTAALAEGRVTWDQVVPAAALATPATDADWAASAGGLSVEHLTTLVRRRRAEARQPRDDGRPALKWHLDPETSRLRYWGEACGDDAARFVTGIQRAVDTAGHPAPGEPRDPYVVRAGAALLQLIATGLGTDADRDRATIVVHVDIDRLMGRPGEATLAVGDIDVDSDCLERLACNARFRLVFDGRDGFPAAYAAMRTPTAPLEDGIRRRDVHCQFPGCTSRRGQIHHIVWWNRGGRTTSENLVLLCWRHHRLVHDGGWTLTGTPGQLQWSRPDGSPYTPGAHPPSAGLAA